MMSRIKWLLGLPRKVVQKIKRLFRRPMRLGVTYNFFDGEDLLVPAIKSIRSAVEHVNVVYQEVSNGGERRDPSVLTFLNQLKQEGLIDEVIMYEPDLKVAPYVNERRKRHIGMRACAKNKCTHYITLDVDEFYRADELKRARQFIWENDILVSATMVTEYVRSPRYRLLCNQMYSPDGVPDYAHFVPFICRVVQQEEQGMFPCYVDPTRAFAKSGPSYIFPRHVISMHHMSTVRKDLAIKYRNSTLTLADDWGQQSVFNRAKRIVAQYHFEESVPPPAGYGFIGNYPVKLVDDEFGIGYAEYERD